MNTKTKLVLATVVAVGAYFVLGRYGLIPAAITVKSIVPASVELQTEAPIEIDKTATDQTPLPSVTVVKSGGTTVRIATWAWNAHMGLFFANGGPQTTAASLIEGQKLRLSIIRQDDTEKSKQQQVLFAQKLHDGDQNPTEGVHFVTMMGDGAAQYLASINKPLLKLGPEYRAEIVGALGYSRGEDAFLGPQEWKDDPNLSRGKLVAGVLRDGDWNLAQYWLAQNSLKNNPNERTIDPDALNWVAADDYLKAVEMFVSGYCEDREVARDGKKTGETVHTCVEGVVTWTPGDVNAAKKRGGLVRLISTKENAFQMPCVVVGIHAWNTTHPKAVEGLLQAAFSGADQVRQYPQALDRAGKASYAVYAEESPGYWVKYYRGVTERDKLGQPVQLGGSTVANLGDNLVLFGLAEGSGSESNSMFKATYEGFGRVVQQQYPLLIPEFPRVADAVNTSFLKSLQSRLQPSEPTLEVFDSTSAIESSNIVARRNWNIQFDTGKASFTREAEATLQLLYEQLVVGAGLTVEIDGHTDNTGNPTSNISLSAQRAAAVKGYLETRNRALFPENRVVVRSFGDTQPIADNLSAEGRSKNRRVTIVLGGK